MRLLTRFLAIAGVLLLGVSLASADQFTTNFTLNPGLQTVPSQGSVTFQLTLYGQIDAQVNITNGLDILGFVFSAPQTNLSLTSFVPQPPNLTISHSLQTGFGTYNAGFICKCNTSQVFTIGNQGQFTSVYQVLGAKGPLVDLVLVDSQGYEWGANSLGGSQPVPEPGGLALIGIGALAAWRWFRKQ